ncbi:melanoregulin-like [Glandiceps talaboti]
MSKEGTQSANNNTYNKSMKSTPSDPEGNGYGCFARIFCCIRQPSPPPKELTKPVTPDEPDEYTNLLSSYPPQASSRIPRGLQSSTDQDELNLWNEPFDPSHTECEEDMKLFRLLQRQEGTKPGSPTWLQYDIEINKIRQKRMDVQECWKVILRGLGFIDEVETGILSPISCHAKTHSNIAKDVKARELIDKLVKESSMFVGHRAQAQSQRYLTIMERLIDLETAEDFVDASIELFPRNDNRNIYSDTEEEG